LTPLANWLLQYMTNVMILTLQSSTFLFYVVIYNFHLYMLCISPWWFFTQDHVLRISTFQNEVNCWPKNLML
jgi:hypothetical protein